MYRIFLFIGIIMALAGLGSLGFGLSLIIGGSSPSTVDNTAGNSLLQGSNLDGIAAIIIGVLITLSGALFAKWSYSKAG
jgi:hypothetical protein